MSFRSRVKLTFDGQISAKMTNVIVKTPTLATKTEKERANTGIILMKVDLYPYSMSCVAAPNTIIPKATA